MERVERRQPKAIGALKEMKTLSQELRWIIRMQRIPLGGKNYKVCAGQSEAPVCGRLIQHDLRTRGVEYTGLVYFVQDCPVDKVKSHCPGVGSGYAAEQKSVPRILCRFYILEARGRFPYNFDKI